jgi:glycerol-3-phosphate acyltransferase PlsY
VSALVGTGLVVAGYALGVLPTAVVVGRAAGHDPTAEGSGNPGATNVYRTAGRRAGALVLAGDVAKGAAAASLGLVFADRTTAVAVGLAAVVGHVRPPRRPGGKGVATVGGVVAVTFPLAAVLATLAWLALARATAIASLASLGALAVVLVVAAGTGASAVQLGLLGVMVALVVVRHAGNIGRLVRGDERSLRAGRR